MENKSGFGNGDDNKSRLGGPARVLDFSSHKKKLPAMDYLETVANFRNRMDNLKRKRKKLDIQIPDIEKDIEDDIDQLLQNARAFRASTLLEARTRIMAEQRIILQRLTRNMQSYEQTLA